MIWSNDYLIGIEEIDDQHKELVGIVESFRASITDKTIDINLEIGRIITFLVKYTNYHFEAEEALMARINYPELEKHQIIHKDLVIQLKEVLIKLKTGKSYKPIEFYYFLVKWLTDHISGEDSKIAKFSAKKITDNTKTDFIKPEDILKLLGPNFSKQELMLKNQLISEIDFNERKIGTISKFYHSISISNAEFLLLVLDSLNVLLEKNHLSNKELDKILSELQNRSEIKKILSGEIDGKQKLEIQKRLNGDSPNI